MAYEEGKRTLNERKRNILYLINQYLTDLGLNATANSLQNEANLQSNYEICDNVDLDTMYLEYCSYFQLKFGKYPRVLKKTEKSKEKLTERSKSTPNFRKRKDVTLPKHPNGIAEPELCTLTDSIKIMQINNQKSESKNEAVRTLRPLVECEKYTAEWKELAEIVCRNIMKKDFELSWNKIFGNETAVSIIKEAVLWPLKCPEMFSGNLRPWKAVLLHGPPGTGKTMIAKVLCAETSGLVAFFNVSASTIISKWRGESEKIIRVLFEIARFHAPSIIFIDEIEGLTSKRDSIFEHEANKRFKNEFLSLLDGLDEDNHGVFVLANTNLPWEIDPAFLRRFERKVLVDLPNFEDRRKMINALIPSSQNWELKALNNIASKCDGYTGDEIRIACKEAAMMQIRNAWNLGKGKNHQPNTQPKVAEKDLTEALSQIKPSSKTLIEKHLEWNSQFGNKF